MEYREQLLWILDKIISKKGIWDAEAAQENIDFVHSLGLKCDCVGWCSIDLNRPDTAQILDRIEAFCKGNGWKARGYYKRTYHGEDSEWYELVPTDFRENTVSTLQNVPCENADTIKLPVIHAYRETTAGPKGFRTAYIPERVYHKLVAKQITGLDFCWLPDVGKYAAEQYFAVYPSSRIARICVGWEECENYAKEAVFNEWHYGIGDEEKARAVGGWLPRITSMFYDLYITLQDGYLAEDLPKDGIALAYYDGPEPFYSRETILIHRSIAQELLRTKVLLPTALRPAMVFEQLPPGYMAIHTTSPSRPTNEFIIENQKAYGTFLEKPRPVRRIAEKEALTQLRRAKRERKEDFQKPLPKIQAESLIGTAYEPMIPYYRITDGGHMDFECEYELLPYHRAIQENREFQDALKREELLEYKPEGVVIAVCADGDCILLCQDGAVIRFSHEEPDILSQWSTLSQFVFEALTE